MTDILAIIAALILFLLGVFQLALIFGAPIGKYAWGGKHNVLPLKLRISSGISIILYGLFAVFILSKANIVHVITNQNVINIGMWVFTAYFFIGIFMNAISRSKPERNLMTPVAAILALCFLLVTIN